MFSENLLWVKQTHLAHYQAFRDKSFHSGVDNGITLHRLLPLLIPQKVYRIQLNTFAASAIAGFHLVHSSIKPATVRSFPDKIALKSNEIISNAES